LIINNSPLPTHGEFSIQNQIRKLDTTHTWQVLDSKSNSKTGHYPHMASFRFKIKFENSPLRTHGELRFKIIFENSPLPTHREFLNKNQIRKLVTTHSRRVFDSKSYSKTRHYPHMASFRLKIIFDN
jgi:hypothetical protein